MKLVTKLEEIIMLAIWRLQDNAYGITIFEEVKRATGKKWLTGSVYASLSRLLRRELVCSDEGEPTPERGGRRKIYYGLTQKGQKTLQDIRRINDVAWADLPAFDVDDE